MSKPFRNLHVPLPEAIHKKLREEADRSGRPATELAREAIGAWLVEVRRRKVHDEVARYAAGCAGTRDDLDPHLERAALEHLKGIEVERE
jgi:hypothetical protein